MIQLLPKPQIPLHVGFIPKTTSVFMHRMDRIREQRQGPSLASHLIEHLVPICSSLPEISPLPDTSLLHTHLYNSCFFRKSFRIHTNCHALLYLSHTTAVIVCYSNASIILHLTHSSQCWRRAFISLL